MVVILLASPAGGFRTPDDSWVRIKLDNYESDMRSEALLSDDDQRHRHVLCEPGEQGVPQPPLHLHPRVLVD